MRRLLAVSVAAALPLVALAACGSDAGTPVAAPQLGADVPAAAKAVKAAAESEIKIGVIYTPGTSLPGSESTGLGEGAAVAAYRLSKAGHKVSIVAASDFGTADGTTSAVEELAASGVVGIVDVSTGEHVGTAVAAASAADLALLLPYDDGTSLANASGTGVWLTGPSVTQQAATLAAQAEENAGTVQIVSTAPVPAEVLGAFPGALAPVVYDASAQESLPFASKIDQVGSVVVWDGPEASALIVAQAERASRSGGTVPILLSAAAQTPAFATHLQELAETTEDEDRGTATLDVPLTSVGGTMDDFSRSEAIRSFLLAVQVLIADAESTSLSGDVSFAEGGGANADPRSYDAVVALVNAVAAAGSDAPAEVRDALGTLTLDESDGIVGHGLDFTAGLSAVPDDDVVAVQSTSQATGLRPAGSSPLTWYSTVIE
ncbi:MAG: hypothetical protein QM655_14905 [Nocardioidaceae bacterium]